MPIINGLLFLVLIAVGITGYIFTQHFDKAETKAYLESCESLDELAQFSEDMVVVEMDDMATQSYWLKKAG